MGLRATEEEATGSTTRSGKQMRILPTDMELEVRAEGSQRYRPNGRGAIDPITGTHYKG